jgi:small subunit ribosomal protein S16
VSVKIRMKRMGRKNRAFFRICATDSRSPRDGRVIEELGSYDPSVPETDARVVLNKERVAYWLGVGAIPSPKVSVMIKKYGKDGTHLDAQQKAIEKLGTRRQNSIKAALEAAANLPAPPAPSEEPAAEVVDSDASPENGEAVASEETVASSEG